MTIEFTSLALIYISFIAFAAKRMMTYMHVLQQEDYDNARLQKWIFENKTYDKRLTFFLIVLGVIALTQMLPAFFMNFLIFICFTIIMYLEKDPRKNAKKKLIPTTRAKRTFFPALLLSMVSGIWCFWGGHPFIWIICVQIIPFVLILANALIKPFEEIIQLSYWQDANAKMQHLQPTVIGITGSFGKTSVKHILGHILKSYAPTLITPGSVNTPMGITRIIRERLDESHKYFIVEMGAYGKGSIKRLCDLTPPNFGVITAIGHAHYERFRSLDTVAQTKFELAEAVLDKEGDVIIHERTLRFQSSRQLKLDNPKRFTVCGEPPEIDPHKQVGANYLSKEDFHINKVDQTDSGLKVALSWEGKNHTYTIPLFGLHHGHNASLAIATALKLGLEEEDIRKTLTSLPQIEHRLEVIKHPDGSTVIDDAYNSNPMGFRSALDLLAVLKTGGKRILITPGIVELGSAHDEAHATLGEYAGEVCDVAVVVLPKRIPSFIEGFKKTGGSKTLIQVETFDEASEWLANNRQSGDLILLENDLPDMYERVPKM